MELLIKLDADLGNRLSYYGDEAWADIESYVLNYAIDRVAKGLGPLDVWRTALQDLAAELGRAAERTKQAATSHYRGEVQEQLRSALRGPKEGEAK